MKEQFPDKIFVTGIGTGIGKTVVSAVLAEALEADYWKPLQCGALEFTDTDFIKRMVTYGSARIHAERYRFETPASPHYAAQAEGKKIKLSDFAIPDFNKRLIVEGAGGLIVPLNNDELVIDLIKYLNLPVILVVKNYLGSINHTLLSIEVLRQRQIDILGIIFNGEGFLDNEEIVGQFSKTKILGRVEEASVLNEIFIKEQAAKLRESLSQQFEL